ncbi:MAG: DUF2298 domain-containing protein [Chloroflexi bacterium]|nr:DUF2298 domain-containing protein [Chloroflexota bacterium]
MSADAPLSQSSAAETEPQERPSSVGAELAFVWKWLRAAPVWVFILLLIAVAALGLRMNGLDWDSGSFYHPDERSIYLRADCMYRVLTESPGWASCQNRDFPQDTPGFPGIGTLFDKDTSPLNPHWFPLGTIIIYLLVAIRFLMEPFMDQVRLEDLASAGRALAAFVDTASVVLLSFLGRRLFGQGAGLLAAALGAFTVFNIQVTHFYRPESFVVLLALVAFWWMLNVLERGRLRDHVVLGLVIGTTFAFRGSSLPILAPVALTYAALLWRRWEAGERGSPLVWPALGPGLLAFVAALGTFVVLQPYALIDYRKYVGDLGWEAMVARTAGLVPYTLQYVGIPRNGLYELRQTAVWALGLPLGIVAWGGLAAALIAGFRRPRIGEWLLIAWVVVLLGGIVPLFEVKFLRYVGPVLPVLVLLGSHWLVEAYRFARERGVAWRRAVQVVMAFVVAATAFYALAFASVYFTDHPGIQASAWMNENAPPGSNVLTDNHWDEGFPGLGRFNVDQLRIHEGDTPQKVWEAADQIERADYIMSYSNRPWGSILRVPERYPYSSAYYRALFAGDLGFELVHGFARYPTLAGVSFLHDPFTAAGLERPESVPGVETGALSLDLGYADENVTNYDHPLVLVWRNVEPLTAAEISGIMFEGDFPEVPERALLSDEDRTVQQAGGTWTDIFNESAVNRSAPWLVWLLAIELVFLAALPLSVRLMRWLPDRGVVLAKPLGLLIVSWLVWMGASVGLWTFSRASVAVSVLLLAAVSAALLYRDRWLIALAKRHWKYVVSVEVLFIAAYLAFLLVRAATPDLWHAWRGGEKPMDLTYLIAVVKSSTFPPYDPWYAGGFINYYYYGFVPVAALIRLTGIVPEVAYNLALPMLFAFTLAGAFSVGYNLAEALRQRGGRMGRRCSPLWAGVAVALLVTVLANVDGAAQLAQGAWRSIISDEPFGRFDFWRSSRLMPGQIAINEFPFWTFLFGDLHAHLISLPYQVLAVGLAANLVLGARKAVSLLRLLPALAGLAFVVGAFAAINTWEVPAYGLLGLAAIVIALLVRGGPLEAATLAKGLLLVALFWLVLYGAWLPFHQDYEAPIAGVKMSQWRTVLWHYVAIHALLLFAALSWLAFETRQVWGRGGPDPEDETRMRWRWRALMGLGALALVLAVGLFAWSDALRQWLTAALFSLILLWTLGVLTVWLVRRRDRTAPVHLLLLVMLVLALGIGVGVDFVTVENDIDRMNTVFKLYLNAWVLFGTVGGVGLWRLWTGGAFRGGGIGSGVWLGLLAALVLASAVFPVLGTRARLADRFDSSIGITLDGRAYQRTAVYGDPAEPDKGRAGAHYALDYDAEAIDFIRENVEGSPVFLEGVTAHAYRWPPRVAKYTGLPVVVGWQWHQIQQRGAGGAEPAAVRTRVYDVRLMYETESEQLFLDLASEYGVEYVYVGPTERVYFPPAGLAKFDAMAGHSLVVFFANQEVTVYRVLMADG